LLGVLLILAGCGGATSTKWQQVHGTGFTYSTPVSWTVSGSSASSGAVDLVEVHTFQLERPYIAARQAATVRELDHDSASVAQQLHGKVSARSSLLVGGIRAWSYSIDYDGKTEQITFALHGRREYELLCRRSQGSSDAVCRRLLTSFNVR
jgi:hypothetical protein